MSGIKSIKWWSLDIRRPQPITRLSPPLRIGIVAACRLSQAELVQLDAAVGIQEADYVTVMTEIGFKNVDWQAMTRWKEMIAAIDAAAVPA